MPRKKASAKQGSTAVAVRDGDGAKLAKVRVMPEVARREAALPQTIGVDMQSLLERAIDKMVPIDYMERLISMMQSQRALWAKEQFFKSLAAFQSECPVIEKTKKAVNSKKKTAEEPDGELLYLYAPYEDIAAVTQPLLTRHGFSATVKSSIVAERQMRAVCVLHHEDGHTEETEFLVPVGQGTERMSPMQVVAAARSFARRWAYIDALGLAMKGEDKDYMEEEPETGTKLREPMPTKAAVAAVQKLATAEKALDAELLPDPKQIAEAVLKVAQDELQDLFTQIVNGNRGLKRPYSKEELTEMRDVAAKSRGNINSLRDLHSAWTIESNERGKA